jgi:hypothetical protein
MFTEMGKMQQAARMWPASAFGTKQVFDHETVLLTIFQVAQGSGVIAVAVYGLWGNYTSHWGMLSATEESGAFEACKPYVHATCITAIASPCICWPASCRSLGHSCICLQWHCVLLVGNFSNQLLDQVRNSR